MKRIVPLERVLSFADPTETPPWQDAAGLSHSLVGGCLSRNAFADDAYSFASHQTGALWHARRIAWLVMHGWDDPIHFEFGPDPDMQQMCWPIFDGNHRLYAATYMKKAEIEIAIGGYLATAEQLLGLELND